MGKVRKINADLQAVSDLRGKRVEIEDEGYGTIVDETENTVGILLDGEGCRVMYVKKENLEEIQGFAV